MSRNREEIRVPDGRRGTARGHFREEEQDSPWKAEKRARRKTKLKYIAGMLALAVTVLLALFLPGWYSGWKEAGMMEQVVLEKREELRLLDMETLDISTKLAMLEESETFEYGFLEGSWSRTEGRQSLTKLFADKISEWKECHLFPDSFTPRFGEEESDTWIFAFESYVRIDTGAFPVRIVIFRDDRLHWTLAMILDQSNDFMYYGALAGWDMASYIYDCLGLRQNQDGNIAEQTLVDGSYSLDMIRDFDWYDYASACNALSQELETEDFSGLYQTVKLRYEEFDVHAYRSLLQFDGDEGIQIMFGTDRWQDVGCRAVEEYMGMYMYPYDQGMWTDEWNEFVSMLGRYDLCRYPGKEYDGGTEEALNSYSYAGEEAKVKEEAEKAKASGEAEIPAAGTWAEEIPEDMAAVEMADGAGEAEEMPDGENPIIRMEEENNPE